MDGMKGSIMKYRKMLLAMLCIGFFQQALYGESPIPKNLQTEIRTIDGSVIDVDMLPDGLRFKGYEKKIILLEFFGHSCPPCRASIPGYNRIQHKYEKDVVVIAIESWALGKDQLKAYAKQLGIGYKVVAKSDSGKVFSFVEKLTGWSPNYGVPFLMLFAPGGKLAKSVPPQRLNETYVESLIEEIRKKE
jgi:thiol-disulfide isomerase/thioredoxin